MSQKSCFRSDVPERRCPGHVWAPVEGLPKGDYEKLLAWVKGSAGTVALAWIGLGSSCEDDGCIVSPAPV